MADAQSLRRVFEEKVMTPRFSAQDAPRTAPGLRNAKPEDRKAPAAEKLNWWQASNVKLIIDFIENTKRVSEGMVLCDAPGLGKTLSVLATIVRSNDTNQSKNLVVVFASKGIVAQWGEQIRRHFDPAVSGLDVFCADKEISKHPGATRLSARPAGSQGGVYVEERPNARLPDHDVLRSFDVLIVAKEMLSQTEAEQSFAQPGEDPPPPPPLKNVQRIFEVAQHDARLIVVDESHNLNKRHVTKQEINLHVEQIRGIPKLLLSGTPGTSPSELYQLLLLIRHKTLFATKKKKTVSRAEAFAAAAGVKAAGSIMITESQWKGQFFDANSDTVSEKKVKALSDTLMTCFLHSPDSVAPTRTMVSVEKVEASVAEVEAYNFALSLHQRDVLRAKPGRKQPDEWVQTRPSKGEWYREKKQRAVGELPKLSGEKTIGDLMRAANGGECWSLTCHIKSSAPPGIVVALARNDDPSLDLPVCSSCAIAVPGLLTLPCGCAGEVCPECFEKFKCDRFERKVPYKGRRPPCPLGCRKKQMRHSGADGWQVKQPQLILQTDEARKLADEIKKSRAVQLEQYQKEQKAQKERAESEESITPPKAPQRAQPPARPLVALRVLPPFANVSDKRIEKVAREWGIGAGGKLIYLAKELRDLAKAGKAKVLITPPANTSVRARFVEVLRELVGRDTVADLNVKKADHNSQLVMFKRGHCRYWRCQKCGEEHEESTVKCFTGTCTVVLDEELAVVRHVLDVARVDDNGTETGERIFIGNEVVVYDTKKPFTGTKTIVGRGTVRSVGRPCSGKRPADELGAFRSAPPNSCFVLVLNPKSLEGTDLPMGTHMYQVEPILREDIEKQAHARALRLGGERKLEIVQLLMKDTIEEQQFNDLKEIRARAAGQKKVEVAEYAGKQATMLNTLDLLRPELEALESEQESEEEEQQQQPLAEAEEEEENVAAEVDGDLMEVDAEEEEEEEVVVVEEGEEEKVKVEQQTGSSGSSRWARAVGPVPDEVRSARSTLLHTEDAVTYDHVSRDFQLGLRRWRNAANRARTLAEVAQLMLELRRGMLDQIDGMRLFREGWDTDGAHCKQWSSAAQAADLTFERLQMQLGQLRESFKPPSSASASAAAAGSSSDTAAPEQLGPRVKRKRTYVEHPKVSTSSSSLPRTAGGGFLDKVKQIKEALEITNTSAPKEVLAVANGQMGLDTVGPLPKQADALMKALGIA